MEFPYVGNHKNMGMVRSYNKQIINICGRVQLNPKVVSHRTTQPRKYDSMFFSFVVLCKEITRET